MEPPIIDTDPSFNRNEFVPMHELKLSDFPNDASCDVRLMWRDVKTNEWILSVYFTDMKVFSLSKNAVPVSMRSSTSQMWLHRTYRMHGIDMKDDTIGSVTVRPSVEPVYILKPEVEKPGTWRIFVKRYDEKVDWVIEERPGEYAMLIRTKESSKSESSESSMSSECVVC